MNALTYSPRFSANGHAVPPARHSIPVRIKLPTPSITRASLQPLRVSSNRIWDPNLLDHLHVPLSRFGE